MAAGIVREPERGARGRRGLRSAADLITTASGKWGARARTGAETARSHPGGTAIGITTATGRRGRRRESR